MSKLPFPKRSSLPAALALPAGALLLAPLVALATPALVTSDADVGDGSLRAALESGPAEHLRPRAFAELLARQQASGVSLDETKFTFFKETLR